ncbi:lysophospholipid acyltransferase family protein [bacterium]|nr:lysophospholipid acyltransferase family protein [bacterium]
MNKRSFKQRVILLLAGTIVPFAIYLLALTWRVTYKGKKYENDVGNPLIWAFWHSRLLPLLFYYRNMDIVVLVSQSFDGEVITKAMNCFGFRTVRGSSTRGGMRGFIGMIDKLKSGCRVAFTPDGPLGPRERVKLGVSAASIKSGAPIIAAEISASRSWFLKSWDRFMIPKPFAKIYITLSEPIYPKNFDNQELTEILQQRLDDISSKQPEAI